MFFPAVNHNYNRKQRTLKHRNTQNRSKSTNHRSQTMTFLTHVNKVLYPKRFAKMIDGSEKCKCQLAFELQSSHVFEKPSKHLCFRRQKEKSVSYISLISHFYDRFKLHQSQFVESPSLSSDSHTICLFQGK